MHKVSNFCYERCEIKINIVFFFFDYILFTFFTFLKLIWGSVPKTSYTYLLVTLKARCYISKLQKWLLFSFQRYLNICYGVLRRTRLMSSVKGSVLWCTFEWQTVFWNQLSHNVSTVEPGDSKLLDSKLLALVNFLPLTNSFIT